MTRIVADTTCGLTPDAARDAGIPLISQVISFGEETYREGVDMNHAQFMERLRSGRDLPKTAAPYPGDFIAAFEPIVRTGESIVCIHPSSDVSGTVRSAAVAKESFPGADIRIIDTRTVAGPLATLVLEAQHQATAGASADEVEACVRGLSPRARIYFLVDTLEFLQRGGRIGGAAALVGSILHVKPLLVFVDGRVEPLERERTRKRALARLKELVLQNAAPGPDGHLSVMHAAAPDAAAALAAELEAELGTTETPVMDMAPAIVTHVGPGALAAGFFTRI
jgi:DegV family protein with EDD domain